MAALVPTVAAPYRSAGFEIAGAFPRYRLPLHHLHPRSTDVTVEPFVDGDLEELKDCYVAFASNQNGLIARSDSWWVERALAEDPDRPLFRYVARRDGRMVGYLTYLQVPTDGELGYEYSISIRDLVWLDAAAGLALLNLLAANRALGVDVSWIGPPADPLAYLLDAPERRSMWSFGWMLRPLKSCRPTRAARLRRIG